jgi:hypothetical protein
VTAFDEDVVAMETPNDPQRLFSLLEPSEVAGMNGDIIYVNHGVKVGN